MLFGPIVILPSILYCIAANGLLSYFREFCKPTDKHDIATLIDQTPVSQQKTAAEKRDNVKKDVQRLNEFFKNLENSAKPSIEKTLSLRT